MYLGDGFRDSTPDLQAPPKFPLQLSGLTGLRYLNLNSCELTAVPEVRPLGSSPLTCCCECCPCRQQGSCRWLPGLCQTPSSLHF